MVKKSKTEESETRKLILIRHSKAEDFSSEISDFERSLTVKGQDKQPADGRDTQGKGGEIRAGSSAARPSVHWRQL
jgi:phosphohistidine phosphatase SixA